MNFLVMFHFYRIRNLPSKNSRQCWTDIRLFSFRFSQDIGLASLGVSDDDIVKLSTLYWFTVEFGLCREEGKIKAYGAGKLKHFPILSPIKPLSLKVFFHHSENYNMPCLQNHRLKHSNQKLPSFKNIKVGYDEENSKAYFLCLDEDYQPIYFLAETFEDAKEKLRIYAKSLKRPYELVYDAYTQSLRILDNVQVIHDLSVRLKLEMDVLEHALDRLQANGINFRVVS